MTKIQLHNCADYVSKLTIPVEKVSPKYLCGSTKFIRNLISEYEEFLSGKNARVPVGEFLFRPLRNNLIASINEAR